MLVKTFCNINLESVEFFDVPIDADLDELLKDWVLEQVYRNIESGATIINRGDSNESA